MKICSNLKVTKLRKIEMLKRNSNISEDSLGDCNLKTSVRRNIRKTNDHEGVKRGSWKYSRFISDSHIESMFEPFSNLNVTVYNKHTVCT